MEILVALISGGSAIICGVITNVIQASATRKLLEYRLMQLEQKVDKHNTVIERMAIVEYDLNNLKTQLKERGDDGK